MGDRNLFRGINRLFIVSWFIRWRIRADFNLVRIYGSWIVFMDGLGLI